MSAVHLNRLVRSLHRAVEARQLEALTDAELLERFSSSADAAAFEAIVRRHGARVLAASRQVLAEAADVDDVFQATFLVLLNQAKRIRQKQSLGGWLYGVAHRLALRARTRAASRSRAEARKPARTEDEPPDLLWREACAILHEELDRLPDAYRLPLLLCYLEGKSRDEAALQLGVKADVLRGRLERGRERLRARLTRRGVTLSTGLLTFVANAVTAHSPPEPLLQSTLVSATSGQLSTKVSALVHGATSAMNFSKFSLLAAAVLTVGLISTGAYLTTGAAPSAPAKSAKANSQAEKSANEKPVEAPQEPTDEAVEVSGHVLGPDGKAIAGAKLFIPNMKKDPPATPDDMDMKAVATSGADGRFGFTYKSPRLLRGYLIAHLDGFGVDWTGVPSDKPVADNLVLKLVKDQPIVGRILDTEGKPVVGAKVGIASVDVPDDEKLDAYLAGWKKNYQDVFFMSKKRLFFPLDAITGAATTDRNGQYRLTGAGVERIVHVSLRGGGVADAAPFIITRDGFDPKSYNEAANSQWPPELRLKGQQPILYGPDATIVAESGRALEGVVKDQVTGTPLAGVQVGAVFARVQRPFAVTDVNGKFQLKGLPQEKNYRVMALPPKGSAYLRRSLTVEAALGTAPVVAEIEMARGVVVSGRVIDRQTGKGVAGGVRFAPLPDNKHFGKPGFDSYKSDRSMESAGTDGRFRVATIPGRSMILVQAQVQETLDGQPLCPYLMARPDPDHKDLFKRDDDGWRFDSAGGGLELLRIENVAKVVDLQEGGGEVNVELFLERGKTAEILLQGPDGMPLSEAIVSGLTAHWPMAFRLKNVEKPVTVLALDPDRPRRLVFLHPEKNLGGTVTLRGNEKAPVTVKLGPLGAVTGRFLEELDGMPLVGAELALGFPDEISRELYRFFASAAPAATTDKEGRFAIPDIIPGVKFHISVRKNNKSYIAVFVDPQSDLREVESGKTLNIGEWKLKPQ